MTTHSPLRICSLVIALSRLLISFLSSRSSKAFNGRTARNISFDRRANRNQSGRGLSFSSQNLRPDQACSHTIKNSKPRHFSRGHPRPAFCLSSCPTPKQGRTHRNVPQPSKLIAPRKNHHRRRHPDPPRASFSLQNDTAASAGRHSRALCKYSPCIYSSARPTIISIRMRVVRPSIARRPCTCNSDAGAAGNTPGVRMSGAER